MKEKMLEKRIAAGIAAIMTAATLCACDDLTIIRRKTPPNRQLLPVQRKSPKLSATDHLKALTAEAQS